jgi:hypothetical protein
MPFRYFKPIIKSESPWFTLKQLCKYSETDETRQYNRVIENLVKAKINHLIGTEAHRLFSRLEDSFVKVDSRTYISCFYHRCIPSANMLQSFGGEIGISVGFDKSVIENATKEFVLGLRFGNEQRNISANRSVAYVSGTQEDFDTKIEMLLNEIHATSDERVWYCVNRLRDVVVEYLFNKSHYYELENEYRVVLGLDTALDSDPSDTQKIQLPTSAIKSVAVHSSNLEFLKNETSDFGNYVFTVRPEDNAYYSHPLTVFEVAFAKKLQTV